MNMSDTRALPLESGYPFHNVILLKRKLLRNSFYTLKWLLNNNWKTITKVHAWRAKNNCRQSVKLLCSLIIFLLVFLVLLPIINMLAKKMYNAAG